MKKEQYYYVAVTDTVRVVGELGLDQAILVQVGSGYIRRDQEILVKEYNAKEELYVVIKKEQRWARKRKDVQLWFFPKP